MHGHTYIKTDTYIWNLILAVSKIDGNMPRISERRTFRIIYGPINDNVNRTRYNNELYTLYDELHVVPSDTNRKIEVAGTTPKMQELDPR